LFFIDEVDHYRIYDESGQPQNGLFATMFEEEYNDIISNLQREIGDEEYVKYLEVIPAEKTHAGYFSIDKKGRMVDEYAGKKKVENSEDVSAYDLIMKNKELLLDRGALLYALSSHIPHCVKAGITRMSFRFVRLNPAEAK
jgi:type III restriction enzyme